MTRFERVTMILDQAVGGAGAPVGVHGPFWRGRTRDEFVALRVLGRNLVQPGNGAASDLIRALKGEAPFGADVPGAPADARFPRMPAGRDPVPPADVAFVQRWIDDGCPEDEWVEADAGRVAAAGLVAAAGPRWRRTNAPAASSRTDDIWFFDERVGFAVNSNGHVLKTSDGGDSWQRKFAAAAYLRCIGFSDPLHGWVGTLTPNRVLFRTVDGGETWTPVRNLPANAPVKVCGLAAVSRDVAVMAGSNDPLDPPRMMKTVDGGRTWTAWDMRAHASILIDVYFRDENTGWVVGGKAGVPNPSDRSEIKPVVLFTEDGGKTWVNRLAGHEAEFPFGEWGWKIHFIDERIGFVSLENFFDAAILKTADGGRTFTRLPVTDPQGNANLEGVGFASEQEGWVGGWGDVDFQGGFSSATGDGGRTWRSANEIGKFLNRFRFIGRPPRVGYASGDTVYKYSDEPVRVPPAPGPAALVAAGSGRRLALVERLVAERVPVTIEVSVPEGSRRVALDVWTRFGIHVGTILDEVRPEPGPRAIVWDGKDDRGRPVSDGEFIFRVSADDAAESGVIVLRRRRRQHRSRRVRWQTYTVEDPLGPLRRFGLVAGPLEAPAVRIDLPDLAAFPTPVAKATFLLQSAAEVEHALLVQYLYAAYSLKRPATLTDPAQSAAVRKWIDVLLGVARQEMGHLLSVQNMLLLLKQAPNFEREDFPAPPFLYPFRLQLEPLTRRSLAKYVVAESPVGAAGIDDIVALARESAGAMPNRVGVLYALLSVVFSPRAAMAAGAAGDSWDAMLRAVAALAYQQDPDRTHWHLDDDAFTGPPAPGLALDEEWSPANEVRVWSPGSRADALAALKDIALQGEGPTQAGTASHFERFLDVFRGSDGILPFPDGEWTPALDVPTNPKLEGDPADPSVIHDGKAKDLAGLADQRYALMLGWLEQCLRLPAEQRAPLVGWCFSEMNALRDLSARLTQLARAGTPPAVAALPFSLPADVHLPEDPAAQWTVHARRLEEALVLVDAIIAAHGATDAPLRTVLTRMKGQDQLRLQFVGAAAAGGLPSAPVGRWARVQRILDGAAGFGAPGHGGLARFWKRPLSEFVTTSVLGNELIAPEGPDRGKNSNLVKVLRGEPPFETLRMPRNRPPISEEHITFIEQWIDAGCPEM